MRSLADEIESEIKDDTDVLLIAGATGSGKTTISKRVQGRKKGFLMSLDDYFLNVN